MGTVLSGTSKNFSGGPSKGRTDVSGSSVRRLDGVVGGPTGGRRETFPPPNPSLVSGA